MAKEPGKQQSLHELRQEAARSRAELERDLSGLRYELNFPLKVRQSFQRQTGVWITAAVVIGVLCAVTSARTKTTRCDGKTKRRGEERILGAGLALGALKLAATLLRPMLANFISRKVSDYAAGPRTGRKF